MTDAASLIRYEPALSLSRLFRPLQARQQRARHSVTQIFSGLEIEWVALEAPGIPEQTLLLALMGLVGTGQQRLPMMPKTPMGQQLREALAADGELFRGETASLHTSLSELARRCGYANCGGANLAQIRRMLKRLAEITVWIRTPDYEASSRLLAMVMNSNTGIVHIALNTRLARAAWGESHYVSVSMAQRLSLSSQIGMALHAYLSGGIQLGKNHSFEWTSLERAVWGDNVDGGTFRSRKHGLKLALSEIARQGWAIDMGSRVVSVSRHSANKSTAKRQLLHVETSQ